MKNTIKHIQLIVSLCFLSIGSLWSQITLEAPHDGDETNYRWVNALSPDTILGTDFNLVVATAGVYYASYDGSVCGKNATSYFILTENNATDTQVTLDLETAIGNDQTVLWSDPSLGTSLAPTVTASITPITYTATWMRGDFSKELPSFTVMALGVVLVDSDGDGILDVVEDSNQDNDNDPTTNPTDTDGDGIPNYLDIDSDNDGIPDNVEAQLTSDYISPSGLDSNNNGLDNAYESTNGLTPIDSDGDSIPDYLDTDSDNDQVPDLTEGNDRNSDGIAEFFFTGIDSDGDGLDDGFEGANVNDIDVNDEIDNPQALLQDTDLDGIPDIRDEDDDDEGILTKDEDTNGDGNYANDDIDIDGIPDYLDPTNDSSSVNDVTIYNVITPNGDGYHDFLNISNIEIYGSNTFELVNRWGDLVYKVQSYNNSSVRFEGYANQGKILKANKKLPVGTYFYQLQYQDFNGESQTKKGYLYINE